MRNLGHLAFMGLVLGVTGCDHVTKHWISSHVHEGQSWNVLTGVLEIRSTFNTDTAFSLLAATIPLHARLALLLAGAGLGCAALSLFTIMRWKRFAPSERVALALVLGGALGNAIDRLLRGHVIDFIYVHYWPVFNVADVAITAGIAALLLFGRKSLLRNA
jgi:signal peptidase II